MLAAASFGFVACNSKSDATAQPKSGDDKEVLYTGILPAADAEGTIYTLKLEFDDDNNYTDGDYMLVENSLAADSVAPSGLKAVTTSYTKGDFTKQTRQVDGTTVEYITLVPDAKDALGAPSASSSYFVINADGSLTMVGQDLQMPVIADLYTLTVVK